MSHILRGHSSMEKSINTINVTLADSLHLQYITLLRRLLGLMSNKTSRLIPPMNGEKTTNILASKTRYFCLNSKLCVCWDVYWPCARWGCTGDSPRAPGPRHSCPHTAPRLTAQCTGTQPPPWWPPLPPPEMFTICEQWQWQSKAHLDLDGADLSPGHDVVEVVLVHEVVTGVTAAHHQRHCGFVILGNGKY